MLLTGGIYTLIGMKNRYVHTFFSSAFLMALGVTVLIIYVMNVPVSNGLQGAYVAATILSACALGAASLFCKELTEGLGCALGGFCLSMWLLCLIPGGLLKSQSTRAALLSTLTIGCFACYFTKWTRDWALIILMSLGGATVTVLGIDCFSRAGLKEFWAYLWSLNDDIFPLGATTYPVTKGIRVETVAIMILCLCGITSQIKLWKIVRRKRQSKAAAQDGGTGGTQDEESVGRQIEEENGRDRRQWERLHGNGDVESSIGSHDFDANGEKKSRRKHRSSVDVFELGEMSESDQQRSRTDLLMANDAGGDGKVTVRVAADEYLDSAAESNDSMGEKYDSGLETTDDANKRRSRRRRVSEAPDIVPLPFVVPEEDGTKSDTERSSVATFADEEGLKPGRARRKLGKRMSQRSTKLLRSLSQRSRYSNNDACMERTESSEELVVHGAHHGGDESVAATVDNMTISTGRNSFETADKGEDMVIAAELSNVDGQEGPSNQQVMSDDRHGDGKQRPFSGATVSTAILEGLESAEKETGSGDIVPSEMPTKTNVGQKALDEASEKPKSLASGTSIPTSLTKDKLPKSMSRVVMSYRTNEWAKHLETAETPAPDDLNVVQTSQAAKKGKDRVAPLNMEDLQMTAAGSPLPSAKLSETSPSLVSETHFTSHGASNQIVSSTTSLPLEAVEAGSSMERTTGDGGRQSSVSNLVASRSSAAFKSINEDGDSAEKSVRGVPIAEGDDDLEQASGSSNQGSMSGTKQPLPSGIVPYSSPQTLIGQRESFLRSKSQGNLYESLADMQRDSSDSGSVSSLPYASGALDPDDMPLSQRKQYIRQSSTMPLSQSGLRSSSNLSLAQSSSGLQTPEPAYYEANKSRRSSAMASPAARELQLAGFRKSVSQDLRAGNPMAVYGRQTPFASTSSLLHGRKAEVALNIEMQRSRLLEQKQMEAQRNQIKKLERDLSSRAFDDKMRTGVLLDAHKQAMKKMQKGPDKR